jgi:hypothetical protein
MLKRHTYNIVHHECHAMPIDVMFFHIVNMHEKNELNRGKAKHKLALKKGNNEKN